MNNRHKSAREHIEVMQAYLDGAKIELRRRDALHAGWQEVLEPRWDWQNLEYRVKPEPREFWANIYPDGQMVGHPSRKAADRHRGSNCVECILVKEVLE